MTLVAPKISCQKCAKWRALVTSECPLQILSPASVGKKLLPQQRHIHRTALKHTRTHMRARRAAAAPISSMTTSPTQISRSSVRGAQSFDQSPFVSSSVVMMVEDADAVSSVVASAGDAIDVG